MKQAVLYGVGVGPGNPELMTLKAVRIIESCPVVAAPRTAGGKTLALEIARAAVSLEGKQILPLDFAMSRDPDILEASHQAAALPILEQLRQGRSVAMVNLGDVSLYASFHHLKPMVEAEGFQTEMIPGVPSFCAVAAALGETLTPEGDAPLHIIPAGFESLEEALSFPGAKVIMKAGKSLGTIKQALRTLELYHKAKLVQNCGLPEERIAHSLDDAVEDGGYFTTMVIKP